MRPIADDLPALLLGALLAAWVGAGIALVGCGAVATSPRIGSETHFLSSCTGGCDAGLECLAGVCTLPCGGDAECTLLDAAATCRASRTSEPDSCQVVCTSDDQCSALHAACDAGRCVAPKVLATLGSSAAPSACPAPPGPPQRDDLETTSEPVPATTDVLLAVADEQGLYWIEADGSVLGLASGSTSSITLRPANEPSAFFTGIVADDRNVYWVEGSRASSRAQDSSSVFSAPKLGGDLEPAIESNEVVYPLGIAGPDVVVVGRSGQLQAVDSGALRSLDHIPSGSQPQILDGALYWVEQGAALNRIDLFSATVTPGPAQRLLSFEGSFAPGSGVLGNARIEVAIPPPYLIGPGFLLWSESHLNEDQTTEQLFSHIDLDTGCTTNLPPPGELRVPMLRDGQNVYWLSYDSALPPDAPHTLLRLNLDTYSYQRIVAPGLELSFSTELVTQDSSNLYLQFNRSGPLVAVRKPDL